MKKTALFLWVMASCLVGHAQLQPSSRPIGMPQGNTTMRPNMAGQKDTTGFQQRDDLKDSITISYRYLDALKRYSLDSSVNDFDKYYPVPTHYQCSSLHQDKYPQKYSSLESEHIHIQHSYRLF
ncbi:MAG: hypothetical protein EOO03_12040 [Chitinophagaceae bacterium]|nr:MAG: hypothetical protein EOO03_12040 [Chitinophagaceae bacterium]